MNRTAFSLLRDNAGYTLVEALTVTAVVGALIAVSAPEIVRFKANYEVQPGISQIGGMLRKARANATADGVPHLVLFEKEEIVDGDRTTFALVVVDNDRSYSVTAADDVEEFELDASIAPEVTQYALDGSATLFNLAPATVVSTSATSAAPTASALDGDYIDLLGDYTAKMSDGDSSGDYSDVMAMYEDKAEDWQSGGNPGCSGAGPCLDSAHPDYEPALDPTSGSYNPQAVLDLLNGNYSPGDTTTTTATTTEWMNGTSFPVSDSEGLPGFAFNERGFPVALDTPTAWGSGIGGVYLTDNRYAVYAAFVSPLGEVSERRYDPTTESWK